MIKQAFIVQCIISIGKYISDEKYLTKNIRLDY